MIIIQKIYKGYCVRRDAHRIKRLLCDIKASGYITQTFKEPKYLKETIRYLDKIGMIKEISDVSKKCKVGDRYNEQLHTNRGLEENTKINP